MWQKPPRAQERARAKRKASYPTKKQQEFSTTPTYPCRVSQHVESFRQIKRLSRDAVNYSCWLHILLVSMRHLVDIQVVQPSTRILDLRWPMSLIQGRGDALTALKHPCCRRNRCHGPVRRLAGLQPGRMDVEPCGTLRWRYHITIFSH